MNCSLQRKTQFVREADKPDEAAGDDEIFVEEILITPAEREVVNEQPNENEAA